MRTGLNSESAVVRLETKAQRERRADYAGRLRHTAKRVRASVFEQSRGNEAERDRLLGGVASYEHLADLFEHHGFHYPTVDSPEDPGQDPAANARRFEQEAARYRAHLSTSPAAACADTF